MGVADEAERCFAAVRFGLYPLARFIQAMLGHAKLETTQIYTHLSIKQLQEVHAATHPAARLERRRKARIGRRSEDGHEA